MTASRRISMSEKNLYTICFKILSYLTVVILLLHRIEGYSVAKHMEIHALEHSCPEIDSCKYQNETKLLSPTYERSCACDTKCFKFDDCCIDAPKLKGKRCDMNCYDVKGLGGIYMNSECPATYEGDESWRQLCENIDIADPSDPIGSMPVTDDVTGVTYKNVYCKLCNGKFDLMKFWKTKLDCPFLSSFNESHTITDEYVLQNLVKKNETWGLDLEIADEMFFFECNVEAVIPSGLRKKLRRCKPNLISDCPSSWENEIIREKCLSFQGPRFTDEGNGYRNVYCAICNNINAADLSCLSPQAESIKLFRFSAGYSFALLLDINVKKGEKVGMIKLCRSGEVYDPFFKKCRELQCLPGYVRRGRKCFPRRSVSKTIRKPGKYRRTYPSSTKQYMSTSSDIATTLEPAKIDVSYATEKSTESSSLNETSSYAPSISPLVSKDIVYVNNFYTTSTTEARLYK